MKQKIFIILAIIGLLLVSGCIQENKVTDEMPETEKPTFKDITVEGVFVKNLGHPFSGPAITVEGKVYWISGEKASEIIALKDKTRVKVAGLLYTDKTTIPEAGGFSRVTIDVINITYFEVIN